MQSDRAFLRTGELAEVGGEALEPLRLLADGDEHLFVGLEDAVEHALDVPLDRRQWGAHLVRDLRDQTRPTALGRLEVDGETVDVARELRELELAGLHDTFVVVPAGEASRRVAHLSYRPEDPPRDERRHDPGRTEARDEREQQRRVERADEHVV